MQEPIRLQRSSITVAVVKKLYQILGILESPAVELVASQISAAETKLLGREK